MAQDTGIRTGVILTYKPQPQSPSLSPNLGPGLSTGAPFFLPTARAQLPTKSRALTPAHLATMRFRISLAFS
jgi:hypothetical protein